MLIGYFKDYVNQVGRYEFGDDKRGLNYIFGSYQYNSVVKVCDGRDYLGKWCRQRRKED